MSAITWSDVEAYAPQFAGSATPNPTRTLVLSLVGAEVHEDLWGDTYQAGALALAAHLLTLMKQRGLGPKVETSAGGLAASYTSMLAFGQLGLTSYGVEYQRLTRNISEIMFGLLV